MKHSKPDQIDKLISDERFRHSIQSLSDQEPIPDDLVDSFRQFAKEDLELARKLIQVSKREFESANYANKERIWQAIEKSSAKFDRDNSSKANFTIHKNQKYWKRAIGYAAVFAGILFLIILRLNEQTLSSNKVEESVEVMLTKTNPSGQKSRITLPDGSIAYLNAESELVYSKSFVGDRREVYLKKGEAYFEVSQNKEKPFVVIIDNISVTALGTEFNVNAFNEDLEVALLEGSIMVNNVSTDDQLIMETSEILVFDPTSNKMNITSENVLHQADWKDQILYFNNTPLNEAVESLSRWYAVEIVLENTPAATDLTVSRKFNNSSLELVLSNLSYSLGLEYAIKDKNVSIKFNK